MTGLFYKRRVNTLVILRSKFPGPEASLPPKMLVRVRVKLKNDRRDDGDEYTHLRHRSGVEAASAAQNVWPGAAAATAVARVNTLADRRNADIAAVVVGRPARTERFRDRRGHSKCTARDRRPAKPPDTITLFRVKTTYFNKRNRFRLVFVTFAVASCRLRKSYVCCVRRTQQGRLASR